MQLCCKVLLLGKLGGKQMADQVLIKMLIKWLAVLILLSLFRFLMFYPLYTKLSAVYAISRPTLYAYWILFL